MRSVHTLASALPGMCPEGRSTVRRERLPVRNLGDGYLDGHPRSRVLAVMAGRGRDGRRPFEVRIGGRVDDEHAELLADVPRVEIDVFVSGPSTLAGLVEAEGDLQLAGSVGVQYGPSPVAAKSTL